MKIKFTIPKPCHENWSNMTPTEQGKHCAVCDKEVFDMTKLPMEEVAEKLNTMNSGEVCARIPNDYLDKKIELHAAGIGNYGKMGVAGAMITAVAFSPMISMPETDLADIAQKNTAELMNPSIQMNGTVLNEKGEIISGVKVIVEQNGNKAFTSSLANGRFVFHLDPQKINRGKAMIRLEKEGFLTVEREILIEGDNMNGKFMLEGMKEELQVLQLEKLCVMNYQVTGGDVKITREHEPLMKEQCKERIMQHAVVERTYDVTGGAVVQTVYLEKAEIHKEIAAERNEIPKIIVEFEDPNQLKTYPNPATDMVNLEMTKEGTYTVYVFAMDGKMIFKENMNSDKMTIDLSGFERGNYIVKVIDAETHESFDSKVVLMR